MSRDALVVGINKYPFLKDSSTGSYQHLTTPAQDAEAIAQILETYGNFRVTRLPASKIKINGKLQVDPNKPLKIEELEKAILDLFLPESEKPPETALLFFAGHGLRKQLRQNWTEGFLATSDASPNKDLWGYSLQNLWNTLYKSQVKQQVIWLDCCFSGELLNFKDTELGRHSSECDRFFIAASRDYEVAYQQLDGKHGVLTGALLSGLDPYLIPEYEWVTNRTLAVAVEQKLQAYYDETKVPQSPLISNHGETIRLIQGRARPQLKSEDEEISHSGDSFLEDKYQLRIALHWLIRLLEDDTIESIQVDSTVIPGKDSSVTMDNIVVCYKDSRACFIQAKKNQPKHEAWSFSDRELRKELCKGRDKLESRENSKVKFYSCSPFGELKKLVEDCEYLSEYSVFRQDASKNQLESLERLTKILDRSEEITYSLVQQISFGPTYSFDDWERQNQLDLERLLPKANLGMLVLERYIQNRETHLRDTKYVIKRLDVLAELARHGLNPTPKRSEAEILAAFKNASNIGRYWIRKIDGKAIPRSELPKLIELIEQRSRTILLTDRPGSGKTCVLLDLADYIEHEKASVWGLLFIKGDQFTNTDSEQKLVAQGFPEDIVGQCARLADFRQVVVIIDSLDVLSLSRQHDALKVFLGIIDRLEKIDGVTVIIACRNFDLQYDPLLRGREWQHRVNLQPLDFDNEVKPFLIDWNVDLSKITPELQELLQVPQNLHIYEKLAKLGISSQPASVYELYNSFLEEVVVKKPTLGTEARVALQNMAEQLMQKRTQSCSKVSLGTSEDIVRQLISQEVLLEKSPGVLAFTHQTLADCITVQAALAKQQTLAQFILDHPQLPFIRPAIRAFFFYLRASQIDDFRRQVWEVLSHDEIVYHVKRLICESFAEIAPVDQDWRLLRRIFQNYPDLFRRLLWRANNGAWWNIFTQHWLAEAKLAQERETWLLQFVQWLQVWMNVYPAEVVAFWREAIACLWANPQNLKRIICSALANFKAWSTEGIQELLETLVEDFEAEEHDYLGHLLSQWVLSTNTGDTLLWKYITKNVLPEDARRWDLSEKLRCAPHDFHQENFLEMRLCQSDTLLTLALDELESWSTSGNGRYGENRLRSEFLRHTSWELRHSQRNIHLVDDLKVLLNGVESALKLRSRQNHAWWREKEPLLRNTKELAIRYFVIEAYKENIRHLRSIKFWTLILDIDCLAGTLFLHEFFLGNIPGIENQLQDEELFRQSDLGYELGELMQMAYPKIPESVQVANQAMILLLCAESKEYEEEFSFAAYTEFYDLLIWIPRIFRTPETQAFIDTWQDCFGYSRPSPNIHRWGGAVMPPLSPQTLLNLSDKTLGRLLRYYETRPIRELLDQGVIGGFSEVKSVLRDACSLNPTKFVVLFTHLIKENFHQDYINVVVEGIAFHLSYRFGNLKPAEKWEPVEPLPQGEILAATLLNWLERYFLIWKDGSTVSKALEACCEVLLDSESAERLSLMLFWLYTKYPNDRQNRENNDNPLLTAINSIHGVAAESAITLCNRLLENEQPVPEMLVLLLRQVARDAATYVRVPVLEHLPFLMYKNLDLGWQLLADVFKEPQLHLWKYIEQCLYYQYRNHFDKVAPYLNRLLHEGMEKAGETWGRISTLASLAGHISQEQLFESLATTNNIDVWEGTTQVFAANLDQQEHATKCISGLIAILRHENLSDEIIRKIDRCFEEENKRKFVQRELAFSFLEALPASARGFDFRGFLEWLGYESRRNPLSTLELTEALAEKLETTMNTNLLSHTEPLIVALSEILREADETDNPEIIQRAINLQDRFLRLDIRGMEELLNRAGQD